MITGELIMTRITVVIDADVSVHEAKDYRLYDLHNLIYGLNDGQLKGDLVSVSAVEAPTPVPDSPPYTLE